MSGEVYRLGMVLPHLMLEGNPTSLGMPQDVLPRFTQASSGLLNKLPAKIRMRIYELALGGNVLEIASLEGPGLCILQGPLGDVVWPTKPVHAIPRLDRQVVASDYPREQGRYNMSLLKTCRQIYSEARLIPYSHNMFTFASEMNLAKFVGCVLAEDQVSAIKNMALCVSFSGFISSTVFDPQVWKRLPAMDFLALKINFDVDDYVSTRRKQMNGHELAMWSIPGNYGPGKYEPIIGPELSLHLAREFQEVVQEDWFPLLEPVPIKALNLRFCCKSLHQPADRKTFVWDMQRLWSHFRNKLCPSATTTEPLIDYVADRNFDNDEYRWDFHNAEKYDWDAGVQEGCESSCSSKYHVSGDSNEHDSVEAEHDSVEAEHDSVEAEHDWVEVEHDSESNASSETLDFDSNASLGTLDFDSDASSGTLDFEY
ncbi:hypothetical protein K490DRAFT_64116 [Saccharata proteae CBS 121410]|uniref:DUF7730 domain-containing protein n=1 Tax=Saccharata proteae CBS 121410 TaxID=1314787 RepID=A0A6A5YDG1_9PEZI|nr:hypothetical protein K490DRAFT_64116 [Saccharata proteae CBS 121410]